MKVEKLKDLKFERRKGFIGSIPRNWRVKPSICPLCNISPKWEMAMKLGLVIAWYYDKLKESHS